MYCELMNKWSFTVLSFGLFSNPDAERMKIKYSSIGVPRLGHVLFGISKGMTQCQRMMNKRDHFRTVVCAEKNSWLVQCVTSVHL